MQNQEISAIVAKVMQNITDKKLTLSLAKTVAEKIEQKAAEMAYNCLKSAD